MTSMAIVEIQQSHTLYIGRAGDTALALGGGSMAAVPQGTIYTVSTSFIRSSTFMSSILIIKLGLYVMQCLQYNLALDHKEKSHLICTSQR